LQCGNRARRLIRPRLDRLLERNTTMSTLSLHLSPSAVARRSRHGWFARFITAVQDSRMRSARAEIARHRHLLPSEFELAGDLLDERGEHQLPFIRRD
jgi:hypothetical protein